MMNRITPQLTIVIRRYWPQTIGSWPLQLAALILLWVASGLLVVQIGRAHV